MTAVKQFSSDRDDVIRVLDAARIEEVVSDFRKLIPSGKEFKCLCPFHDDKNPSMYVVPHKQIFKCFVCDAKGDVITFVQRHLRLDFPEALAYLAQKYNIELKPRRSAGTDGHSPTVSRQSLTDATTMAARLYQNLLADPVRGKVAREMINSRGITPHIAERFMLGASEDAWDTLTQHATRSKIEPQVMLEAGLIKPNDHGGFYDVFRNRLMFPIQDLLGRVIAFGARRLNEEEKAKYINSPESKLFNKSATLYALNHASREIQRTKTAIITEGYMDTIACHQAGVENVVAVLGTGLTQQHASILTKHCSTVVLLFDGDEAGQRAADRTFPIFFDVAIDVKVATLSKFTDAKDPDELLKRPGGREIFDRMIAESEDIISYRFARIRSELKDAGTAEISKRVNQEIANLVDLGLGKVEPVRRELLIRHLAKVADVKVSVIERAIPTGRSPRDFEQDTAPTSSEDPERKITTNERILGCLISQGSLWESIRMEDQAAIAPDSFEQPRARALAEIFRNLIDDGQTISMSSINRYTDDSTIRDYAVDLMAHMIGFEKNGDLTDYFRDCISDFHRRSATRVTTQDPVERFNQLREHSKMTGVDRRKFPRLK